MTTSTWDDARDDTRPDGNEFTSTQSPTLILWVLDSTDEKEHRKRATNVITQLNQRISHLMNARIIHNEFLVMDDELPNLPVQSWLNPQSINQWIASDLVAERFSTRVLVIPLFSTVDVIRIANLESYVRSQFTQVRTIAEIPLEISLLMYVGERTIKPGVLKNFWPRMYISDRVLDWQSVLETTIVSYATSGIPQWIEQQRANAHASGKELDALWLGSGSIIVAERQIRDILMGNLYRRIVGVLRADDLTQAEIDESRTLARQQRHAYLQQAVERTQQELKTHLGWTITPVLDVNHTSAKVSMHVDNVANTIQLNPDAVLANTLFDTNKVSWLVGAKKYTFPQLLRDYLAKDTAPDVWPDYHNIQTSLASYLGNLNNRMSNLFRKMSQDGIDTFFAQIYEQIQYKRGYGIRDIQQNIADYIAELEQTELFEINNESVLTAPTSSDSYIQQLTQTLTRELQTSERKIVRRRMSVYSLPGTLLRLIIAIPLMLGLAYAFLPRSYHGLIGILVPLIAVAIAGLSSVSWYRQYWAYARSVRHDFMRQHVAQSVLGIVKYHFVVERNIQLQRLRALFAVYSDLLTSFDSQTLETLAPYDDVKANKYIIQQLVSVFGDSELLVEQRDTHADDMRAVVGEIISFYHVNGMESLSQYGKIISEMNQDAQRNTKLSNGYLMLVHNVVAYMLEAQRNRDTVIRFIRSYCEKYVNKVMSLDYNRLNIFVATNEHIAVKQRNGTVQDRYDSFAEGRHWRWLNNIANLNTTPRPVMNNVSVTSHELVLISKYLRPNLISQNGRHNKHWQESFIEIDSALDYELSLLRVELDYDERGRK
jgi:hypothetical protein